MSVVKAALKFLGGRDATSNSQTEGGGCSLSREAVLKKASCSVKDLNNLLGCVTKELAEGDLELADFVMQRR